MPSGRTIGSESRTQRESTSEANPSAWKFGHHRADVDSMVSFVLALLALVIAILHGTGRGNRVPLWVAVALLAVGLMLPWLVSMSLR